MQIVTEPVKGLKSGRVSQKLTTRYFQVFPEKMMLATSQRRHSTRYYYSRVPYKTVGNPVVKSSEYNSGRSLYLS